MVEGERDVVVRLAAKRRRDPDLVVGLAERSGSVSRRSSHDRVLAVDALTKLGIWSEGIRGAYPQAGGRRHDVSLRAPAEWDPGGTNRICKFSSTAVGLNDAPAAFQGTLQRDLAPFSSLRLGSAGSRGPEVSCADVWPLSVFCFSRICGGSGRPSLTYP